MYDIFYIPVNFAFNLPHYVTNAMCTTQVKKRVKKKKKKIRLWQICFKGIRTRTLRITLELKVNASIEYMML